VQTACPIGEASLKKRPLAVCQLLSHIDSAGAKQAFANHTLRFAGRGIERRNLSR
jgi:hypothetical protein